MKIADYKTYLINKVQQDINNTRKRLSQNFTKIKSKIYFFRSKKKKKMALIITHIKMTKITDKGPKSL